MPYVNHVQLFVEALELFTHTAFQLGIVRKTASSDCILQGIKKMEVRGTKSGLYGG
jgi:hypothetical protein